MKAVHPVRLEIRETGSAVHQVRAESSWPPAGCRSQALAFGSASCHFPDGTIRYEHTFEEDVEVVGPMALRLEVESGTNLRLFAGVRKLSAGREVFFEGSYGFGRDLVTRGFLRLDQPGSMTLDLLPSATFFRRGEVLRLDLQGRYFFWRHPLLGQFPAGYEHSGPGLFKVERAELEILVCSRP